MRLEWLEDVLAVAETGSFQDAADRRRLTQSAFSRRIQHIEDQIGVSLFDRSRKPVQLLPATADQKDEIARLATELRQLVADLRRGERIAANRIAIASQHALTTSLAPRIVRAVHARDPSVHVRLRSANLDECFALLLSRQVDVAVVYRLPGEDHPISQSFVETAAIGTDRLLPVLARGAMADLAGQLAGGTLPWIAFPPEVFLGRVLGRVILPRLQQIARPVPRVETALTLAALELAAEGVGVAWVPASLAAGRIGAGSLVDLSGSLPSTVLEVTAVRLFGNPRPVGQDVWADILSTGA
jgi:LysR family transcriptional regulator, hypochlorite-specific transcription factor HypT